MTTKTIVEIILWEVKYVGSDVSYNPITVDIIR